MRCFCCLCIIFFTQHRVQREISCFGSAETANWLSVWTLVKENVHFLCDVRFYFHSNGYNFACLSPVSVAFFLSLALSACRPNKHNFYFSWNNDVITLNVWRWWKWGIRHFVFLHNNKWTHVVWVSEWVSWKVITMILRSSHSCSFACFFLYEHLNISSMGSQMLTKY